MTAVEADRAKRAGLLNEGNIMLSIVSRRRRNVMVGTG